jgi:hypothetical protein
MKRILTLTFISLLIQSCRNESSVKETEKPKEYSFFIKDYQDKFKHNNLREFEKCAVNDLNKEKPIYKIHYPILDELALQIYQNEFSTEKSVSETTKVLYSIQNTTGHQGILIAGMDDDWVDKIAYYSFDLNGKFIAKLILYECGGDGGYYNETYGKFINDTVYVRHSIGFDPNDEDMNQAQSDTTMNEYIVHRNGEISKIEK